MFLGSAFPIINHQFRNPYKHALMHQNQANTGPVVAHYGMFTRMPPVRFSWNGNDPDSKDFSDLNQLILIKRLMSNQCQLSHFDPEDVKPWQFLCYKAKQSMVQIVNWMMKLHASPLGEKLGLSQSPMLMNFWRRMNIKLTSPDHHSTLYIKWPATQLFIQQFV